MGEFWCLQWSREEEEEDMEEAEEVLEPLFLTRSTVRWTSTRVQPLNLPVTLLVWIFIISFLWKSPKPWNILCSSYVSFLMWHLYTIWMISLSFPSKVRWLAIGDNFRTFRVCNLSWNFVYLKDFSSVFQETLLLRFAGPVAAARCHQSTICQAGFSAWTAYNHSTLMITSVQLPTRQALLRPSSPSESMVNLYLPLFNRNINFFVVYWMRVVSKA